jgi:LacI family transcriptional regulator
MKKQGVTIHDIAKELNTTASTVSRALQNHTRISEEMRKKVFDLAQKLNYQPNSVAANLRRGHGNTIGVIVPQIDRTFFSSVIRGLEDVAYEAGFNVIICQSYNLYQREKSIVQTLLNGKVDALMVSFATETKDFAHFENVKKKGIPLIFFDRIPDLIEANKVEVDDFAGASKAVEHLILQGCKRIAHFAGPQHISIYRNRFEGYKTMLQKHNIPFDEKLVFENVLTLETGKDAALEISQISPMPDGLFSAGDYSALGAMLKFKELNIKIPHDIAVVGFSNEPHDSVLTPSLSSVDQHSIEIGRSVGKLFLDGLNDPKTLSIPKRIVLNTNLIIRESSLKQQD